MTEGGSPAREPPSHDPHPLPGVSIHNQKERTFMRQNSATPAPDSDRPNYARMPFPKIVATSREIVDELVRRLGIDEVCRQLDMTEGELQEFVDGADPVAIFSVPDGWDAPDEWLPGRILDKDEPRAWRLIHRPDRTVTDNGATVSMRATQYTDNTLEDLRIVVYTDDDPLNSDQARELAAALLEAAAEADGIGAK